MQKKIKQSWLRQNFIFFILRSYRFGIIMVVIILGICLTKNRTIYQCYNKSQIDLVATLPKTIKEEINKGETDCYQFYGVSGKVLTIETSNRVVILTPTNQSFILQGVSQYPLTETGTYTIRVGSSQNRKLYELKMEVQGQEIVNNASSGASKSSTYSSPTPYVPLKLSYNFKKQPPFQRDKNLQKIVDNILEVVQAKNLSTNNLSISLVKLNDWKCCAYASYLDEIPRFPASISKLFWMVALYAQYQEGILSEGTISEKDIYKMIQDSDNEPASRVVDLITNTESGKNLPPDELNIWLNKRQWINHFFQQANYQNINISQKNFPIPYLSLLSPEGRDLQIRGNGFTPIRNFLTTYDVARLLFEIEKNQSVSPNYSKTMKEFLKRNLRPEAWKNKQYNSIEGFLAESLPVDAYVASKVGWTSDSRQDAAIIESPDGKTRYILVIFADDPLYAQDWKIFPTISRMVYDRMIDEN